MPSLPKEPKSGAELEDYVAALFQGAGYYVEKNIVESDPTDVLELDIVATDYRMHPARVVLAEAKSGTWGYKDLFKVIGQMLYLKIKEGTFFIAKKMEGKPPEKVEEKVKPLGVRLVDLEGFSNPGAIFKKAGLGEVSETEMIIWRWSHVIERKLVQIPAKSGKKALTTDAAAAIRQYHRLVNDGIFFMASPRERIAALYEAYQAHPRLSAGCAAELRGEGFDAQTDASGGPQLQEAMRVGKYPLLQASFYVEHRARLAILKCAIDLLAQDPALPKKLQERSPGGFRYLVLPNLPASFREGLEWLSSQATYRQYARFWQVLLWACGGFILMDKVKEETQWLSEQTNIPETEIPTALEVFDRFFPLQEGWLTVAGATQCRIVKMVPVACRGVGANLRKLRYGWNDFHGTGYTDFTSSDLSTWNSHVVQFVA